MATNPNQLTQILAKNVLFYREQNNLTQEKLAEKLGVSTNTIYKIEKAKELPAADTLQALINLFHIRPYQLFIDPIEDKVLTVEQISVLRDNINNALQPFNGSADPNNVHVPVRYNTTRKR